MEDFPSPPQPRSLPVVVLDAITPVVAVVRRPFRRGLPLAFHQIVIGIGVGIVVIGVAVLSMGVQRAAFDPPGTPGRAAAGDTPTGGPVPGSDTPTPTPSETTPDAIASGGSTPPSSAGAPTNGATAPTGPERTGTGTRAEPLRARFSRIAGSESLTSYRATVTITNPGPVAVASWTVTITLPRETLTLSNVEGATADRNAATWTIVPLAAAAVTAGSSVSVSFQVNGAAVFDATPTGCTINGQACTGLDR